MQLTMHQQGASLLFRFSERWSYLLLIVPSSTGGAIAHLPFFQGCLRTTRANSVSRFVARLCGGACESAECVRRHKMP